MFKYLPLANQSQAVVARADFTKAVTVLVMFRVGSRYEQKSKNGIAHFTEHMMFKGTKRRPNTLAIARELDAVGADYNAFTGKEYTGYYIKADSRHLPLALDILSDMLFNSKFSREEIERERRVIIEEINMYEDTPMAIIEDVFDSLAFQGNSLAWDVAGSKETVLGIKRSDFLEFTNKFYQPRNMFISIAGAVDFDQAEQLLKRYFLTRKNNSQEIGFTPFYHRQRKPRVYLKKKNTEQVHLALGFVGKINYTAKQLLPLRLANVVLGGNMSSRLFISVRERNSLCYYIRSKVNTFQDVGSLAVYSGLDAGRLELAVKVIMQELKRLKKSGISQRELDKAKEYVKGKIVLNMEDSANLAQWFAEHLLFKPKILTPAEMMAKVDRVGLTEVNKAIRRVLQTSKLNLALIGPERDLNSLRKLLII